MENIENYMTPGQRINEAETAIGLGRRTIKELVQQEPVDEEAIASIREQIVDARQERRLAMCELRKEQGGVPIMPRGTWWPR